MHGHLGRTLLACAAAVWTLAQPAPLPADLTWLLQQGALFSPDQVATLNAGKVIAKTDVSRDEREAAAAAIVRISAPMECVVAYFHQLLSYVDGEVTLGFGTFSHPPVAADLAGVKLDAKDVDELQSCRPGHCNVRMGSASMADVRSAVDWKAPGAADRASDWARSRMLAWVSTYLERGDAALITYDDQSKPVKLAEEWRGIIQNSKILGVY